VSVLPINFEKKLYVFYEIQYAGNAIEGDLDAIIFNPAASSVPKWRTSNFEVDAKLAPVKI
jgi:hypothetical protein